MKEWGSSSLIDTKTVLYGVFGDPIGHSKSPLMLNRAFREAGLNAAYAAFHIQPGTLKAAVDGIRALQFRGVNVTIPHKLEVMDYMDAVDPGAEAIGAVNTIVNDNGKLTGYNTDCIGYVRSLKEETGISLKGKRICLLGAGGAARGLVYALAQEKPAAIRIMNRTVGKAEELAATVKDSILAGGYTYEDAHELVRDSDIVINTTQVGMHPEVDAMPLDPALLHEGLLVSDIVYNPLVTRLLREAEARGARIHGGLGMFVYQGAYAFEYWTGVPAPVAAMREEVERAFGVRS